MGGGQLADTIRAFVALDLDAKSLRRVVRGVSPKRATVGLVGRS